MEGGSDPDNAALEARRRALRDQLARHTPEIDELKANDTRSAQSGISQAWRLSSEFVAGVVVGTGLGWGIDHVLGTTPWGLIVFMLLGFAAAVMNVLRASGQIPPSRLRINPEEKDNHTE